MARRKRRRKGGKRRVRGRSGRFQKRRAKRSGGKIPTAVLKRRLARLKSIVEKRS